jgi:hypothetical protein
MLNYPRADMASFEQNIMMLNVKYYYRFYKWFIQRGIICNSSNTQIIIDSAVNEMLEFRGSGYHKYLNRIVKLGYGHLWLRKENRIVKLGYGHLWLRK